MRQELAFVPFEMERIARLLAPSLAALLRTLRKQRYIVLVVFADVFLVLTALVSIVIAVVLTLLSAVFVLTLLSAVFVFVFLSAVFVFLSLFAVLVLVALFVFTVFIIALVLVGMVTL